MKNKKRKPIKMKKEADSYGTEHAGPTNERHWAVVVYVAIIILVMALAALCRPCRAGDLTQSTVAVGVGAASALYLDAYLPDIKQDPNPMLICLTCGRDSVKRHALVTILSLGLGLGYEAIRKQVAHEDFDMGNVYAASLGTAAAITVKF